MFKTKDDGTKNQRLLQLFIKHLISSTPRQILLLIPDAENGLFSRFIFYYMNVRLEWLNVFADKEETAPMSSWLRLWAITTKAQTSAMCA